MRKKMSQKVEANYFYCPLQEEQDVWDEKKENLSRTGNWAQVASLRHVGKCRIPIFYQ